MREYQYNLRAHHGMCLAFFKGKGYSDKFTAHMQEIQNRLKENPLVRIQAGSDDICSACPHNRDGHCETGGNAKEYDRQVLLRCGISEGQVMPYSDFEKKVNENILLPGKREEICGNCRWNGLCQFCD